MSEVLFEMPTDLGGVDDFSQGPHQGAVDPHQLLSADLVGFVQHHAHLVLVVLQSLDHLGELVGDVQLVGVEQEDDAVHALSEPLQHGSEVITWGKRAETRQSDRSGEKKEYDGIYLTYS